MEGGWWGWGFGWKERREGVKSLGGSGVRDGKRNIITELCRATTTTMMRKIVAVSRTKKANPENTFLDFCCSEWENVFLGLESGMSDGFCM